MNDNLPDGVSSFVLGTLKLIFPKSPAKLPPGCDNREIKNRVNKLQNLSTTFLAYPKPVATLPAFITLRSFLDALDSSKIRWRSD